MQGKALGGLDALLAIAQMPGGVPVGTLAIGSHGAKNAALLAIRILANSRPELREKLRRYHEEMVEQIESETL
jgi:5-(carboxyamino)imidazole ribonucleotide mutase